MHDYQTRQQSICIDGTHYDLQTLKDRQQFDDAEQQAEAIGISSATWSLFGVVWPASRVLADAVSQMNLGDKKVLEIGCGIALSSIVLHQRGIDITASDYHPLTQRFLDHNVAANHLPPIKYASGNWSSSNPGLGDFDLIIGSDILYEPNHAALVSAFISHHSERPVDVLIVDPNRGNRSQFTKRMTTLGYAHDFERFDVSGDHHCKGRLLHYHRGH